MFGNQSFNKEEVISNIVKRMDTILKTPESVLCVQYEELNKENDQLYFIAKGKCRVEIKDKFIERQETFLIPKILEQGDHFGEISMLYNCKRSATVSVERSYYLTCAKINRNNYNELLQIYPVMNNLLKEYTKQYDDPIKLFLEMSMNQIDFFKNLSPDIKTEWIYNMQLRNLEQGAYCYQLDTFSEEMYVIQSGEINIM